ncbi:MAG: hypothetical protein AB7P20_11430 [Rhizobiaceae bacterium]
MSFLPPPLIQRRPLTPDEQLRRAEQRFAAGAQPQNVGQGFQQLANGFVLGQARDRANEGKLPHDQSSTPFRKLTEALMSNQAPWQFPGAPQQGGGNAPSPKFDFSNLLGGMLGRRGPTGGGLY